MSWGPLEGLVHSRAMLVFRVISFERPALPRMMDTRGTRGSSRDINGSSVLACYEIKSLDGAVSRRCQIGTNGRGRITVSIVKMGATHGTKRRPLALSHAAVASACLCCRSAFNFSLSRSMRLALGQS